MNIEVIGKSVRGGHRGGVKLRLEKLSCRTWEYLIKVRTGGHRIALS